MWPFRTKSLETITSEPIPETKSLGDPTAEELAIFGAIPWGSTISNAEALSVPAVASAVRLISEAVASLDITVKRKVGDEETDVLDHPAIPLLTRQANGWTSSYELIRDLVGAALTTDKGGLAYVVKVNGEPREILRYRDSIMTVDYDQETDEPKYRVSNQPVPAGNVIHVRGQFSRCPLSLASDAIAMAKAMESYANGLWTNGARLGGVLESPKPIGDTGMKSMLAGWKASYAGKANAGKTAILWDGVTYKQMAMTSVDGEFTASRTFQINEICRIMRVPPGMIYEMGRATYSNVEQQGKEFLLYTLVPWIKAVESALNRALISDEQRGEYRIAFDLDDISQADLTARATAVSSFITSKVINPNEARAWLGMGPRAGGDEFSNPAIDVTKPANQNKPQEKPIAADQA